MFGFRLSGEGLFCKGLGQPENGEGRLKSGVQTAFGVTWVVKIMGFASLVGRMLESTAGCQMTTVCLGSSGVSLTELCRIRESDIRLLYLLNT